MCLQQLYQEKSGVVQHDPYSVCAAEVLENSSMELMHLSFITVLTTTPHTLTSSIYLCLTLQPILLHCLDSKVGETAGRGEREVTM